MHPAFAEAVYEGACDNTVQGLYDLWSVMGAAGVLLMGALFFASFVRGAIAFAREAQAMHGVIASQMGHVPLLGRNRGDFVPGSQAVGAEPAATSGKLYEFDAPNAPVEVHNRAMRSQW